MKGLLGYFYVLSIIKISTSYIELGTPLKSLKGEPGIYITRVEDDLVLIRRDGEPNDYLIHPGNEAVIQSISNKDHSDLNECNYGVECPIIMNVGGSPTYRVSQGIKGKDPIVVFDLKEGTNAISKFEYTKKYNLYSIKQIDDSSFLILGWSGDNKRFIAKYNILENKKVNKDLDAITCGIFVTKNYEVLVLRYFYQKKGTKKLYYIYANFYQKSNLEKNEKESKYSINEEIENPFFYITELNDNKIIACYATSDGVKCFSGNYNNESEFFLTNGVTLIKGTTGGSFKIVQFQEEYAIISQNLNYIKINYDFTQMISNNFELQINKGKSLHGDLAVLNDYKLLFLVGIYDDKSKQFDKIFQIFYQAPYCQDMILYPKINEEYPLTNLFSFENTKSKRTQGPQIIFKTNVDSSLFTSLDSAGDNKIVVNKIYTTENLKFQASQSTKVTFSFQVSEPNFNHVYEKSCEAVFIVCHERCETCSGSGSETNHNCNKCKNDYYEINFENSNKCLLKSEKPKDYYVDEENKKFLKCHENCKICKAGPSNSSHNCEECNKGFFFEKVGSKNCISTVTPKMYLDTEDNTLKECYGSCLECKGKGNDEDHNCIVCDNAHDYFKLQYDDKIFCYKKGEQKSDYYYDESTKEFKKCFETCSSCSKGGNKDEHNCNVCKEEFYKWEEDKNKDNCYAKNNLPQNNLYFEDNLYHLCDERCETCLGKGTQENSNCETCAKDYFFYENEKNCSSIEDISEGYYFDEASELIKRCHENCKICKAGPINSSHNCEECRNGFFFEKVGSKNCINTVTPKMYLDTEDNTLKECYGSCLECKGKGNDEDHNCTACDTAHDYFKLQYDDKTFCYKKGEQKSDYYYDENTKEFKKCFETCSSCSKGGNKDEHNCDICKEEFYKWEEDKNKDNCYAKNNLPQNNLYFEDNLYHLCDERCETCLGKGTQENSNCETCAKDYFFYENEKNCSSIEDISEGYYFDEASELIKRCHENCKICKAGPSNSSHNCEECNKGFFFEKVGSKNCISTVTPKMYLDTEDNTLKECYGSCLECKGKGNDEDHNCTACDTAHDYFKLQYDDKTFCYKKGEQKSDYYYDESTKEFKKCFETCSSCSKGGNKDEHNCNVCKEEFYKWEEDKNKDNCYKKNNLPQNNLYFEDNLYHLCDERCETCLGKGTQENSNCETCAKDYFFYENEKNCSNIEDIPEGYYFDKTSELIRKCHENCTSCEKGGTKESSNCIKCAEGYVFSSFEDGICIAKSNKKSNEYIDEKGIIRECHKNCGKCEGHGTDTDNNCTECIENYGFIDGTKTCMSKEGEAGNYYFDLDENIFKKCYDTCLTCSDKPDANSHNCKVCQEGLIFTSTYSSGSCLTQEEISVDKDELQKFIPIFEKSPYNKTLTIKENYTFFYYTSDSSVQSTDISYILLGECEMKLKEYYNISKNEKLYIGLILDNTKASNMTYSVYDPKGKKLDLSICSSVEVFFPMNKNDNETGLLSLILSNPKAAKRINLYNPEDSFYTNPCDSFEVDGKEVSLEERQEMFNKEMQFCPSGCSQKDYSLSLHQISCTCEPTKEISESDSFSSASTSFQVQVDSLSLFKCTNLLKKYPGKSYLQWSTVGSFAVNTVAFLIMQFSLSKMIAPMPNPTAKGKGSEKWIEMKENPKSNNDYSIQVKKRKNSRMPYLNKDEDEEKDEYKSSNFSSDFIELIKNKLFILSIFTNVDTNFLLPMRMMLNLTTIAVILFVNALLYKKDSFKILNALYAFLISFVLYKIGYEALRYFCKYSKKIRIISVVEFSISTILCFVIWYYVYIFGVVFEQYQGKMLFLFLISISFFVAFQVCFALLTAFIKSFGYEPYSKCIMALATVLDRCC